MQRAEVLEHPEPQTAKQLRCPRTQCTLGICLLVVSIRVQRLVGDLVALDPLQEIIHYVLPVPLWVVGAGNFHLLPNRQLCES